jgi:hypothetical protein
LEINDNDELNKLNESIKKFLDTKKQTNLLILGLRISGETIVVNKRLKYV